MDTVVVGGGAAGVIAASRLLARAMRGDRVHLVERSDRVGEGVAYSTTVAVHRVNVPAHKMSIEPGDDDHFVRYLETNGLGSTFTFAPRSVYGDYLRKSLADSIEASSGHCVRWHDSVISIDEELGVRLASGASIDADDVVLAVGHGAFSVPLAPGPGVVTHPWRVDLRKIVEQLDGRDSPIVVVGTGLSAADVVAELDTYGCSDITAISQRGRFPEAQLTEPEPALLHEEVQHIVGSTTAAEIIRAMRLLFAAHSELDWRRVIDGVRPVMPQIWPNVSDIERDKLFRRGLLLWEHHRNRMPPETAEVLTSLLSRGRLTLAAGRVHGYVDGRVQVRRAGENYTVPAELVICCTGPSRFAREMKEPLIDQLLERRYASPGRTDMGLATDLDGRVTGDLAHGLWAIGPVRRGSNWESFTTTEILAQADVLATCIAADRGSVASAH